MLGSFLVCCSYCGAFGVHPRLFCGGGLYQGCGYHGHGGGCIYRGGAGCGGEGFERGSFSHGEFGREGLKQFGRGGSSRGGHGPGGERPEAVSGLGSLSRPSGWAGSLTYRQSGKSRSRRGRDRKINRS